ncbi:acyclic terpene utilization AtuA family protein [Pseudalkalibacillus decolorationis]|uniref:acyclic terpene utilization AtuA family protein n=1 Tax=Pseudalkalibacillus decolorationis TaxID=163879 RepID=UPI00214730F0|nr:acyclic terpene utilization AtuA family protein [Pseudalkalibacillus decolorationis]
MLRIGSGAGFSGDRIEPAEVLLEHANLDYLVMECLAERTIALAQQQKSHDVNGGYDPLLKKRIKRILPLLVKQNVRLITNMGAANPIAGAEKIIEIAKELNLPCKVAAVTGDDVSNLIDKKTTAWESDRTLSTYEPILSANAYLGIDALLPALETDATIIITGRVADPSLFLAPIVYHFNWSRDDYEKLGRGTVIGHLLECAGQISGGYFADPGKKDVPDLANIGFPYSEIDSDGTAVITKVEGTGGLINLNTVKEQLLYEVHNPAEYKTPDVTADFSTVHMKEIGENQVQVWNGSGKKQPETLKVSVGYHAGYLGVGEISYAGSNALSRAELAADILKERLSKHIPDLRVDFIGVSSVHRTHFWNGNPYEVRLRIAGQCPTEEIARLIGEEVEALYTNGPAGGGGARKRVTESIGVVSSFISREWIKPNVSLKEWGINETI